MSRFPQIFREGRPGKIPLPSDIGLDILSAEVFKHIPQLKIANERISNERVKEKVSRWLFGFETNPEVIGERQQVTKYALENPDVLNVIDHLTVYPNQISERDDHFSRYTGMTRRFETFTESLTALKNFLSGSQTPEPLTELLNACDQAAESIGDARRHLDPEFELRIEVEGEFGKGVVLQLVSFIRQGKCNFVYVLVNKANGSIRRGEYLSVFGIFTPRRQDYFLEELDKCIEDALQRAVRKVPFLKRVFTVNGELKYIPANARVEGVLHFAKERSNEEGTFSISYGRDYHDTPHSIIEMARFSHNYQVIHPFEDMISEFEDTIVELRALSTICHFFEELKGKGYPLSFPEILSKNTDKDLRIKRMYHPLLAHFTEKVIPNDVETLPDRNVMLITGANNNGKTCYIAGLGLSQVLFQAGLPILCEKAGLRVKDKMLTHFVRPGDIKLNQSRFAHECERVLKLIEYISSDSLILCDELFTGTAPQDGEVVSKLLVETLVQTSATVFFVTHYHALGDHFGASPYVSQLCCKLDHSSDPPGYTYRIKPGISKDSDGLVIASEYGVNGTNLKNLIRQKARRGDIQLREGRLHVAFSGAKARHLEGRSSSVLAEFTDR